MISKEDIQELRNIINEVLVFNDNVTESNEEQSFLTLAHIIAESKVLNKNYKLNTDFSSEISVYFNVLLINLNNNLSASLKHLAIVSNTATFFWTKKFISFMLLHNKIVVYQKDLFIHLIYDAITDLDKNADSRFFTIEVMQEVYLLLNDLSIPYEELIQDIKGKQILDLLEKHQKTYEKYLDEWEVNNYFYDNNIQNTNNMFEDIENFLRVSDDLNTVKEDFSSSVISLKSNENIITNSLDEQKSLSQPKDIKISLADKDDLNSSKRLSPRLDNFSEATNQFTVVTDINEHDQLSPLLSKIQISDTNHVSSDEKFLQSNITSINLVNEEKLENLKNNHILEKQKSKKIQKTTHNSKKTITPVFNQKYQKQNKPITINYNETVHNLNEIINKLDNNPQATLSEEEEEILYNAINLEDFDFCNLLVKVPNLQQFYNLIAERFNHLSGLIDKFTNKLKLEKVVNRLDKFFYKCAKNQIYAKRLEIPSFYYNYVSKNGDFLCFLYVKYGTQIFFEEFEVFLNALSLHALENADINKIMVLNAYFCRFLAAINENSYFNIYINSDLHKFCSKLNNISEGIAWRKLLVNLNFCLNDEKNDIFNTFIAQLHQLNKKELEIELTKCNIHIFFYYPNHADEYIKLFINALKKYNLSFDENNVNYNNNKEELQKEVMKFFDCDIYKFKKFLDVASYEQLSLVITKDTLAYKPLLAINNIFSIILCSESEQFAKVISVFLNKNADLINEEVINGIIYNYKFKNIDSNETEFYIKPYIFPEKSDIDLYFNNLSKLSADIISKISLDTLFEPINNELSLLDIFSFYKKLDILNKHKKFIEEFKIKLSLKNIDQDKNIQKSFFIMTAFPGNTSFIEENKIFESIIDWRIVNYYVPNNYKIEFLGCALTIFEMESNILKNMYLNFSNKLEEFITSIKKVVTNQATSVKIALMHDSADICVVKLVKALKERYKEKWHYDAVDKKNTNNFKI